MTEGIAKRYQRCYRWAVGFKQLRLNRSLIFNLFSVPSALTVNSSSLIHQVEPEVSAWKIMHQCTGKFESWIQSLNLKRNLLIRRVGKWYKAKGRYFLPSTIFLVKHLRLNYIVIAAGAATGEHGYRSFQTSNKSGICSDECVVLFRSSFRN